MVDLRKIVVIFIIAVLFSVFVFSAIEAVYPSPKWEDYCTSYDYSKPIPYMVDRNCTSIDVPEEEHRECSEQKGYMEYRYDSNGCAYDYFCQTCQRGFEEAREYYDLIVFIVASILGLVAIVIALYLPTENDLNEWIGTGFMVGGLFVLFYGTARYFQHLGRFIRPIVILIELLIVIYLAYKKLSTPPKKKR